MDPKGACVGARGSRVRQVVNELRGEKVDVVQWRDNVGQFIAEALGPAKVKEVKVDEENKVAEVVVSEHQLSLAIGKEGQNARLAARLSGYKVDIRSDQTAEPEPALVVEDTAPAVETAPDESPSLDQTVPATVAEIDQQEDPEGSEQEAPALDAAAGEELEPVVEVTADDAEEASPAGAEEEQES